MARAERRFCMSMSPMQARIAAYKSWAKEPDRSARTAPARQAAELRFERLVDPDNTLTPQERALRAQAARKAFYLEMSMKGVQARQKKATALPTTE